MTWYWWVLLVLAVPVVMVNIALLLIAWRVGVNRHPRSGYRYLELPRWWPPPGLGWMRGRSFTLWVLGLGYTVWITPEDRRTLKAMDIVLHHEFAHITHMRRWLFFPLWLLLYFAWPRFRMRAECLGFAAGIYQRLYWEGTLSNPARRQELLRHRSATIKQSYATWGISRQTIYSQLQRDYERLRAREGAV